MKFATSSSISYKCCLGDANTYKVAGVGVSVLSGGGAAPPAPSRPSVSPMGLSSLPPSSSTRPLSISLSPVNTFPLTPPLPSPESHTPMQCSHVRDLRYRKLFTNYKPVLSHLVYPSDLPRSFKKRAASSCADCEMESDRTPPDRLALLCGCLECPTFRCLHHILPHLRDSMHPFALSLEMGHIYCLKCGDFVYDRMLEGFRNEVLSKFRKRLGLPMILTWNPTEEEIKRLNKMRSLEGGAAVRGMVNMGNTCFMNCVLQCLLHSPSLRDYFLSHQHICSNTEHAHDAMENGKANGNGTIQRACIVCEMHTIFQFFYSGTSRYSFVPSTILHTVWTRSHLSGYRQHDAHEFFITAIEMLHKDAKKELTSPSSRSSYLHSLPLLPMRDCDCIIDTLFTGLLQSDLQCSHCGNVSTKVDPCWDVSLNLTQARDLTLEKCLEGYVCSEKLDTALPCPACGSQKLHKQLSFLNTPIISVFHLKRFEHDTHLRKKIITRVAFPEKLDMSPYTTSYRNNPALFQASEGSANAINRRNYQYTLFGVVQHEGSLDSGHYTALVRSLNTWYLCDDEKTRPVPIERVLSAEAYILFYHITHLKFK